MARHIHPKVTFLNGLIGGENLSSNAFASQRDAIAGGVLDEVHSLIGHAQDFLAGATIHGERRHTEAGSHLDIQPLLGKKDTGIEQVPDASDYRQRVFLRGLGQQNHELVAPVAEGIINHAQVTLHNVADHPKQFRANQVPMGIVHLFEVIEVKKDDGELVPVTGGTVDFGIQNEVEVPGVVKRGAVVGDGQFVDTLDVSSILERNGRVIRQILQDGNVVLTETSLAQEADQLDNSQDFLAALDGDTDDRTGIRQGHLVKPVRKPGIFLDVLHQDWLAALRHPSGYPLAQLQPHVFQLVGASSDGNLEVKLLRLLIQHEKRPGVRLQ